MLEYLEKLRNKPEHERRKKALFISLGVTVVIAVIWGVTMFFRMDGKDFSFSGDSKNSSVPGLRDTFSNLYKSAKDIFNSGSTYVNTEGSSAVSTSSATSTDL